MGVHNFIITLYAAFDQSSGTLFSNTMLDLYIKQTMQNAHRYCLNTEMADKSQLFLVYAMLEYDMIVHAGDSICSDVTHPDSALSYQGQLEYRVVI